MRQRLIGAGLVAVFFALVLAGEAGAGPPAHCFRVKPHCDLTYYEAAQAFKQEVRLRGRPRLSAPAGVLLRCGATTHRSSGFARCSITFEGGGLPVPCTVEALLRRKKGTPFRVLWWKESRTCAA